MIIFKSINKLNKEVNFKANIGFVPTMGSLHNGHISLIKSSKKNCKKTLVSIFINPSQFNKKNDLKKYPRNLKKDIKILKKINIDYLLIPSIKEIISVGSAMAYSVTRSNSFKSLRRSSNLSTIFSISGSMLRSFLGVNPADRSFLTTVW